MNVCAPDSNVLSLATLPNEIFCGSSLIENLVVCVLSTPQQQNEFYSATTGTDKL
jgi:hypothetical protein